VVVGARAGSGGLNSVRPRGPGGRPRRPLPDALVLSARDPEDLLPPKRCPECGRFLSNELVGRLAEEQLPCPRCETPLSAEAVVGGSPPDGAKGGGSIRPPDLDPQDVRDAGDDVLSGWDPGADAAEVASWADDQRPLPVDTIVVLVGLAIGAAVGAIVPERRRVIGAMLGAVAGAVTAGASRRLWELRG